MNMMFTVPAEEYYVDDEIIKVMRQLLIRMLTMNKTVVLLL